jgi:hypothetical protein
MDGLQFQTATAPVPSDPARADIACFVGFVATRSDAAIGRARLERALQQRGWTGPALPSGPRVLPAHVAPSGDSSGAFPNWLERLGWQSSRPGVRPGELFAAVARDLVGGALVDWWTENAWLSPFSGRGAADLLELADVPVPIDTWDAFDALFGWNRRPLVEGRWADTSMGAAVRRFFLQGGRKCYVVRVGDASPLFVDLAARVTMRSRLHDVFPAPTPVDRSTWRGVAHLFGLPDVSLLCLPDLPELFAMDVAPAVSDSEPTGEERFIECATRISPLTSRGLRPFPTPRSDESGFRAWAAFVGGVGELLRRQAREVQFVAALPLAADERSFKGAPEIAAERPARRSGRIAARAFASRTAQWEAAASIQTAFVQLVYPWLVTAESGNLPGGVEAPDGMLAGMLAASALTRGSWQSIARTPAFGLIGLEPTLSPSELARPLRFDEHTRQLRAPRTIRERISVFAPTATGFQLLSDVTTDDDEAYRPANVSRLVAAIVRAARLIGEDTVFANSGERVWRTVQSGLEELLLGLWGDGALAGESSSQAFEVRCDRSTMTQADIDGGRVIARVEFTAARPLERITVVLAMDEGGQITLVPSPADGALEAPA